MSSRSSIDAMRWKYAAFYIRIPSPSEIPKFGWVTRQLLVPLNLY